MANGLEARTSLRDLSGHVELSGHVVDGRVHMHDSNPRTTHLLAEVRRSTIVPAVAIEPTGPQNVRHIGDPVFLNRKIAWHGFSVGSVSASESWRRLGSTPRKPPNCELIAIAMRV